uniref:Heparan-alpha-glucosaminide N-acetyltransferase catalytic domain-containing protein n=1 Tax=Rhodopseudomonas palustris (strain BisA53) TaxID=316055 RepID=Q07QR2_RHOP5
MLRQQPSARQPYVDVFRGLLIAHMGLDHASLMFNAGRGAEELAAVAPAAPADLLQFLTRFTGVPVAPGFFFMAGFMVALTSFARAERGVAESTITRTLVIRGLVLLAADALILGLPRAAMGFYSFVVLSSIGASIILLALIRHWPSFVLLPAALAVLLLHPLLDVSMLPVPLRAILYEPVREGAVRSLYPLIPWTGIVVLGFVVGRDSITRERPRRLWLALAALSALLFALIRLNGGYGNAYPYTSIAQLDFWSFAKYPPDLPFLSFAFTVIFLALAALWSVARDHTPALLRPFEIFGRVPFFFYLVHFFVLGLAAAVVRSKVGLPETYLIWLGLLVAMLGPCAWYFDKKQNRPNFITRYF